MIFPKIVCESCNGRAYWLDDLSPYIWRYSESFGFRWYGVAYVAGALIIYVQLLKWCERGNLAINPEAVPKVVFWILTSAIVGGRLGDMLLYNHANLFEHPQQLLTFDMSGMSIHGGIASVIVTAIILSRSLRTDPWRLVDALAAAVPLGIAFGRIANFINGELWGRITCVPWAFVFKQAPTVGGLLVPRHPSQLYAAGLEGFALFWILGQVFRRNPKSGVTAGFACCGYGVARFIDEFWRAPEAGSVISWRWMTEGQMLSLGMIVAGIAIAAMRDRVAFPVSDYAEKANCS